jgi:hypothetical protein
VVALIAVIVADANYLSVLDDLRAGSGVERGEVPDAQDAVDATSGIWALLFLGSGIAFVAWFYRAYVNLGRMSVAALRYRPGWAIGAWFVPILNLFRPKQIANDVWRATEPQADRDSNAWRSQAVSPLVHWWWALWMVGGILGGIATGLADQNYGEPLATRQVIDDEQNALTWNIVASLVLAAAAVLGALVVHRMGAREDALIAALPDSAFRPPAAYTAGPRGPQPTSVYPYAGGTAVTSSGASGLACPVCGWRFKRLDQLGEHVGIHHPNEAAQSILGPSQDGPPGEGPSR